MSCVLGCAFGCVWLKNLVSFKPFKKTNLDRQKVNVIKGLFASVLQRVCFETLEDNPKAHLNKFFFLNMSVGFLTQCHGQAGRSLRDIFETKS